MHDNVFSYHQKNGWKDNYQQSTGGGAIWGYFSGIFVADDDDWYEGPYEYTGSLALK